MHRLHHRVVVGDRHLDVADRHWVLQLLVYLICKENLMGLNFLVVVQNLNHLMQDVVRRGARQNLGEQNLVAIPPFLDVVHQFLVNLQVVVVGAELRHLLKMDCFLDVVDAELRHLLKMDYFLDEVPARMKMQPVVLPHFLQLDQQLRAWPLLPYLQSPWLAQV
jgi:hypothetical protein